MILGCNPFIINWYQMIKRTFLTLLILFPLYAYDGDKQLQNLIEIGLKNNQSIRIAKLQLAGVQSQERGSYSGFLPTIGLSVGKDLNQSDLPDFYSSGISIDQTIFDGAQSWYASRSVANRISLSELSLKSNEEQVVHAIKTAYYSYLRAMELAEVSRLSLELAISQLKLAEQQFELKAVSETDLLKAKVRKGQAEASILQSELSVQNELNALNVAIGKTAGHPLNIEKISVELPPVPEYNLIKKNMLSNNTQLKKFRYQEEGASIALKTQTGIFFPTIRFSSSYSTVGSDLGDVLDGYTTANPSANLSISLPIFTGLSRISRYDELKYNVLQSRASVAKMEDDLIAEMDNLVTQLNTYHKLIPINEEIILSAEMDLKLAKEKYDLGANDILDLLNSQVSLIQAKSDLVRLKYDAKITESKLEVLMGTVTHN